jgi:hypothetical protein
LPFFSFSGRDLPNHAIITLKQRAQCRGGAVKTFTVETMQEILRWLYLQKSRTIEFEVLNPDLGRGRYAGSLIMANGMNYRHRSYKAWNDLAELLFCRMLTPKVATKNTIIIRYEKIDMDSSFHNSCTAKEKYGADSPFFAIEKNEEPAFIAPYLQALDAVSIDARERILSLGINRGDEFETIRSLIGERAFAAKTFIGLDHSKSAIEVAKSRFPFAKTVFYEKDFNSMDALGLERSDLIISIGALQSSGINFKPFFMHLIQNYLSPDGAVILGFPNCRWIDGEMIYGAKAPNYSYSEQSILYNDAMFCKRYLQQHKFRVTLTGKNYLFLTATKIGHSHKI